MTYMATQPFDASDNPQTGLGRNHDITLLHFSSSLIARSTRTSRPSTLLRTLYHYDPLRF